MFSSEILEKKVVSTKPNNNKKDIDPKILLEKFQTSNEL